MFPSNLNLEKSVLAVMLDGRHKTAVSTARTVLKHADAFYDRNCRIVWLSICDLDDNQFSIDAMSVAEKLMRWSFPAAMKRLKEASGHSVVAVDDGEAEFPDSALAAIGGHAGLMDLAGAFAPATSLEQSCKSLWELHGKRELITRLASATQRASTDATLDQCLDDISGSVLDIGRSSTSNEVATISESLDASLQVIKDRASGTEDRILIGSRGLDSLLSGLRSGGLYILAARPGAGKTSMALTLARSVCEQGKRVLFFSLEMTKDDLAVKLLAQVAAIDFRIVESGVWEDVHATAIQDANAEMRKMRLDIFDGTEISAVGVRSMAKRQRQLPDLIVVDYLQLLQGSRPGMSEYESISEASRTLKIVARELRIPVLALAQLNRDSEKGTPRPPKLVDLKGSGSIEQDADAVIFIHRTTQDESAPIRELDIVIAKNRFGPMGTVPWQFIPSTMTMHEVMRRPAQPAEEDRPAVSREVRINRLPVPNEDVF